MPNPNSGSFLQILPSQTVGIPADLFQSWSDSLRPVINGLDLALKDKARQRSRAAAPAYFIDLSELNFLWTSVRAIGGRQGEIDAASMLIEMAIGQSTNRTIHLPPGTILEINLRLRRDTGASLVQSPIMQKALERLERDPGSAEILNEVIDALPNLPSTVDAIDALSSRKRRLPNASAYATLGRYLQEGRLTLSHDVIQLDHEFDQDAFAAALRFLSSERPRYAYHNFCDALNITYCAQVRVYTSDRNACWPFIISRGRLLARAAEILPFPPQVSPARRGGYRDLIRDARYLYQLAAFNRLRSEGTTTPVDEISSDLATIERKVLSVLADDDTTISYVGGDKDQPRILDVTRSGAFHGLTEAIAAFRRQHASYCPPLFHIWQSHRVPRSQKWLEYPYVQEVESGSDRAGELTGAEKVAVAAEDARVYVGAILRKKPLRAPRASVTTKTAVTTVGKVKIEHFALARASDPLPFMCIDVVADYYTLWWLSRLINADLIDWVARFRIVAAIASERLQIPPRHREIDESYSVLSKEGADPLDRGRGAGSEDVAGDDQFRLEFLPGISLPDTDRFLAAIADAEAVRVHTKYGDAWMNFVYTSSGGMRTGLVSHIPVPDFIARMIEETGVSAVNHQDLVGPLSEVLSRVMARSKDEQARLPSQVM
jgi:hypothetical protein